MPGDHPPFIAICNHDFPVSLIYTLFYTLYLRPSLSEFLAVLTEPAVDVLCCSGVAVVHIMDVDDSRITRIVQYLS